MIIIYKAIQSVEDGAGLTDVIWGKGVEVGGRGGGSGTGPDPLGRSAE